MGKGKTTPKGTDTVTVTCYGQTETMTRKEAIEKYYTAMRCCEGAEKERYCEIYCQLVEGCTECSDCC